MVLVKKQKLGENSCLRAFFVRKQNEWSNFHFGYNKLLCIQMIFN